MVLVVHGAIEDSRPLGMLKRRPLLLGDLGPVTHSKPVWKSVSSVMISFFVRSTS